MKIKNKISYIKLLLLLLFYISLFTFDCFAQFTSVPIRLVKGDGTPLTGQAANIEFTKYPHSYSADVVAGITVTEVGTAGNYIAKGFTTFQYVKLWISGVNQTWFDSVLTGNIFTWANATYGRLGSANTWTGTQAFNGTTTTIYYPYINNASTWYSGISIPSDNGLVFRLYADSVYGIKKWFLDGTKLRLLNTYQWYGISSTVSPIPLNGNQFTWSGDQLNLNTNWDSVAAELFSAYRDTAYTVLGVDYTLTHGMTLKKRFYSNSLTIPDFQWVSYNKDASDVVTLADSFAVINDIKNSNNSFQVSAVGDEGWLPCDTLTLTPGKWHLTYMLYYDFQEGSGGGTPDYDSVFISVSVNPTHASTGLVANSTAFSYQRYDASNTTQKDGILTWQASVSVSTTNAYYMRYKILNNSANTTKLWGATFSAVKIY